MKSFIPSAAIGLLLLAGPCLGGADTMTGQQCMTSMKNLQLQSAALSQQLNSCKTNAVCAPVGVKLNRVTQQLSSLKRKCSAILPGATSASAPAKKPAAAPASSGVGGIALKDAGGEILNLKSSEPDNPKLNAALEFSSTGNSNNHAAATLPPKTVIFRTSAAGIDPVVDCEGTIAAWAIDPAYAAYAATCNCSNGHNAMPVCGSGNTTSNGITKALKAGVKEVTDSIRALMALGHYITRSGDTIEYPFKDINNVSKVKPSQFPKVKDKLKNAEYGVFQIDDKMPYRTSGMQGLMLGTITLRLQGVLTINKNDCTWSFKGTLSAYSDTYDFNQGERGTIGEFLAWIGRGIPGKPYTINFPGTQPITETGISESCRK